MARCSKCNGISCVYSHKAENSKKRPKKRHADELNTLIVGDKHRYGKLVIIYANGKPKPDNIDKEDSNIEEEEPVSFSKERFTCGTQIKIYSMQQGMIQ